MGANGNKKDTKKFAQEVENITNGEYSLTGEYILSNIETTIRHNKCGGEFIVKPVNFCRKEKYIRCPYCSDATNKKKTTNQFREEVKNIDNNYVVLGDYIDNHTKVKMQHLKCKRVFDMKPNHFLSGERCPYCNKNFSRVEDRLLQYISVNFPQYTTKKIRKMDKETNKWFEIDIFIPELNIGFEYNGVYWHSTLKKSNGYHKKKQEFFKKRGINLYFLWEFWGEQQCKNIIKHIITNDNQIESSPYIELGTKYLYANKDLYPKQPPYIKGYKFLESTTRKRNIKITNNKNFDIYNSGYWKYIKQ